MSLLNEYTPPVEGEETEVGNADTASTLGNLAELYQTVSEEAFTVGDVNNYLQRRAARVSATIQDAFRTLTTFDFKRPEVINVGAMSRTLGTRDYTDLAELTVYVPVGFQGDLKSFVTFLTNEAERVITSAVLGVLAPAQKCFSHYINQPADSQDRRELIYKPTITPEMLKKVVDGMGQFTIAGNRRTTAALADVFENKNSIPTTADLVNKLNTTVWRQASPEKVEAEAQKLAKLATTLFGILESSDNGTSAEFLTNLTKLLKDVGEYLEWYAAFYTRLGDLTAAMKLNEKILLDLQ